MPIYEYVCDSCSAEFELMQKMGESSIQECEKCGQKTARRTVSHTSFMLKGTGWYATDYAGKKAHGSTADAPSPCAGGGCSSGNCPAGKAS